MTASDQPWSAVPDDVRFEQLAKMFVERDIERSIHRIFDRVRTDRRKGLEEPRNVVIVGETGVGKTKILSRYLSRHPERREDGSIIRPVLLVEIKNSTNPTSLAKLMLQRLGITDDRLLAGSAADLSARVKIQFVAQKVELVMIDEFSNAIPDTGRAKASSIATWVKDLSKAKTRSAQHPDGLPGEAIPFVLCGTDKVERIVDPSVNDELATLTPFRIRIPRYGYGTVAERDTFRAFLNDLDDELPFDEFSQLGHVDGNGLSPIADKIHIATYGILRLVGYLVREAAEAAITEGSSKIMEHHLWQSIEMQRGILEGALRADDDGSHRHRPVVNPFAEPIARIVKRERIKAGFRIPA
ncbi:MAG: TniB family NTP-binding protein [Acidobacteria bacterium]|nr:TniB family NTP-binding protein [Acidobacteriota bacterium]